MSLIKQLWMGIALLLVVALGGTLAISLVSAKVYLLEQLRLKNIDNANTLALAMSQMDKDPVAIELFLTAQFDVGHYEYIIFNDPNKKPIIAHNFSSDSPTASTIPAWFSRLANLDAAPGIAQVQDGWQQYGTLLVKSHSRFALESLWHNARDLLDWFIVATLLSGLIGSFVLKYIARPLEVVVQQAEAIGERRFITSSEPKTKEFRRLVRAMNNLSQGVQAMLEKDTRQLEILRRDSQFDLLTGMAKRAHFLNLLDSKLSREDSDIEGTLALARVMHLAELNVEFGHAQIDQLLRDIAKVFHELAAQYPYSQVGRLNGSDFAIVIPTSVSLEVISAELSQKLNFQLLEIGFNKIALPVALINYRSGQERHSLLHELDGALAQAELKGNRAVITYTRQGTGYPQRNLNEWRTAIVDALESQQLHLGQFPVRQSDGKLLHLEAPVRLQLETVLQPAGYFVPWAARLGLMPTIDLAVVHLALQQLTKTAQPLAINISADALCNLRFREQALFSLRTHLDKAVHLWLEFSEICALRHMEEFHLFASQLRQLGCKVGMEHVGLEFTQFRLLQDIGLSYLKVDSAIVRDIDMNINNQQFLQGLCQVGHSLGMQMIAEGVNNEEEQAVLFKLGIDAITGPHVR